MKKLYIFDFFGVISTEIAPVFFKNHFSNEEALKLKEKYFVPADLGEFDVFEIASLISKDTNIPYNDILNEWKNAALLNYELLEFIKKIKNKYNVALLSNSAQGFIEYLYPDLKLSDYFDKVFISGYHYISKPNILFYNKCINSFDIEFDEIYMIDDNIQNLKILNETKIKQILYKNSNELYNIIN